MKNRHGIKDAVDLYRTFGGDRFPHWKSFPTLREVEAYRVAGIRCRERGEELFVHEADQELAAGVDRRLAAPAGIVVAGITLTPAGSGFIGRRMSRLPAFAAG